MLNEDKQKELIQSVSYLKLTIPRMRNLEIPVTPENYSVWYQYSAGDNLDLSKAIDDLLNNGASFTAKVNSELYDTHIAKNPMGELVGVQNETERLVLNLLSELEGMHAGTNVFSNALNLSQRELKKNPDIKSVTRLVSNLIEETELVKKANSSMEKKLNAMKEEVDLLKIDLEALNVAALTDRLTGIPNRRAFDEEIESLVAGFHEKGMCFSLLMLDIDHFKQFNDTYGHSVGDKVLSFVARVLKKGLKGGDVVARYGGEEFVVLLPMTGYDDSCIVAQQLCDNVAQKTLTMSGETKTTLGNVTISVGVATISPDDDVSTIVRRADQALYFAKEQGRNRVVGERALVKDERSFKGEGI